MEFGFEMRELIWDERFNNGVLDSFLVEITRDVLSFVDDDGTPLLSKILDAAGQKGIELADLLLLRMRANLHLVRHRKVDSNQCSGPWNASNVDRRGGLCTLSFCDSLFTFYPN